MSNNIPLAMHEPTNKLVFIQDVQAGKNCSCFCLECREPLIAKKGEINTHHFSHGKYQGVSCPLTVKRCVIWMWRELFSEIDCIDLPKYDLYIDDIFSGKKKAHQVTQPSTIHIDKIQFPENIAEGSYQSDTVLLSVGRHFLALTLSAKSKESLPYTYKGKEIAHISLAMNSIVSLLESGERDIKQAIKNIIVRSESKKWLYHPRQEKYQENDIYVGVDTQSSKPRIDEEKLRALLLKQPELDAVNWCKRCQDIFSHELNSCPVCMLKAFSTINIHEFSDKHRLLPFSDAIQQVELNKAVGFLHASTDQKGHVTMVWLRKPSKVNGNIYVQESYFDYSCDEYLFFDEYWESIEDVDTSYPGKLFLNTIYLPHFESKAIEISGHEALEIIFPELDSDEFYGNAWQLKHKAKKLILKKFRA